MWKLKKAACREVLNWAPFEPGALKSTATGETDSSANNTWNMMHSLSKFNNPNRTCVVGTINEAFASPRPAVLPPLDSKLATLPGAGKKACVTHTNMHQSLAIKFTDLVRPDKSVDTNVSMFDANYNPTPIFDLLNDLYAMHVTGVVNVWATHKEFNFLKSSRGILKPAMVYNTEISKLNIMIEKPSAGFLSKFLPNSLLELLFGPKPCAWYVQKIETALIGWRNLACPAQSRARLKPNLKGEVTEYDIFIIDENYLGWGQNSGSPQTGFIQTCQF